MQRKFLAHTSNNKGTVWDTTRATGWVINCVVMSEHDKGNPYGYVLAIDNGGTMIDIEISERTLRLILKEVSSKRRLLDKQRPAPQGD